MAEAHESPSSGIEEADVFDPRAFQRFSPDQATVVRVYGDDDVSVVVWNLEPGQENPLHLHPENAHALTVLEGAGLYLGHDGSQEPVKAGDCIIVPRGRTHGIRNTGAQQLSYLAVTTLAGKGYVRNLVAGDQGHR